MGSGLRPALHLGLLINTSIFSGDHLSLCMYSLWDGESLELPLGEGHRVLGRPFSSTSRKDRGRRL